MTERETIAKIIEPFAWSARALRNPGYAKEDSCRRADSLVKADAILALTPVEGVGMREGLTDADIFDMGYAWQQMLTGQTLEDARAVGRTLGCDLFQPIAEHIDAAEKEMGFNPFQTSDLGIVQAKAIIKAAIARHRARSTPAAQEDEVREAQPVCDSCGTEWFSTDSKCHLCRRGEMTLATLTKGARDAG